MTPLPPSLRVLVVDDQPNVLSLIRDLLIADGHEVETLADGRQALARATAAPFDVILSDLRMPSMSGHALHRALATAHPELARRLVFITGDPLAARADDFLALMGTPTLAKPFTWDELRSALRAAVDGGREPVMSL